MGDQVTSYPMLISNASKPLHPTAPLYQACHINNTINNSATTSNANTSANTKALRLLVLGPPSVGKTTLISAAANEEVDANLQDKAAYTITFSASNRSSVTEIRGLHTYNKYRGEVWRSVVDFILNNPIDVVWYCVASDYLEESDEVRHWVSRLSELCGVVLVRTKSVSPSQYLQQDVESVMAGAPVRVQHVLSRDMALNPKGGGAVVEAYGIEDLISATEQCLSARKNNLTPAALSKLLQAVKNDGDRYAAEDARKGMMVNALRSMSAPDPADDVERTKQIEEEFVLVQDDQGEGTLKQAWQSKRTKTIVGAILAFAVVALMLL